MGTMNTLFLPAQLGWRPVFRFAKFGVTATNRGTSVNNHTFVRNTCEVKKWFSSTRALLSSNQQSSDVARLAFRLWKPAGEKRAKESQKCPVYLTHGLLGYKEEFDPFGQSIADRTGHDVFTFDARNHGESAHVNKMDYVAMGNDLMHFMEQNDVSDAIFVGHSMGAGASMAVALQRSDLVKGIFCVDISLEDAPRRQQLRYFLQILSKVKLDQTKSLDDNRAVVAELLRKYEVEAFLIGQRILPNIVERDGQVVWRINLPVFLRDIVQLTRGTSAAEAGHLIYNGPAYFLVGNSSDFVTWENEQKIFTQIPQAEVQRVDNAGHWVHVDQPKVFLDAVVNFINKINR